MEYVVNQDANPGEPPNIMTYGLLSKMHRLQLKFKAADLLVRSWYTRVLKPKCQQRPQKVSVTTFYGAKSAPLPFPIVK